MRAIISGAARTAAIYGPEIQVRRDGVAVAGRWQKSDIVKLLGDEIDVVSHDVAAIADVDRLTDQAWAKDRALRFALFLLDMEEPLEELQEYAECLEGLISQAEVLSWLQTRMSSLPIADAMMFDRALENISDVPSVSSILQSLKSRQSSIVKVSKSFESTRDDLFGGSQNKDEVRSSAIREGDFVSLVEALEGGKDITFERLKILSRYRAHPEAINQWTAMLQAGQKPVRLKSETDTEDHADDWRERDGGGHVAYRNVRDQQTGIIAKLREGDFASARRFAEELIATQTGVSTPDQIAKSYSLLAHEAKLVDAFALQLEWAEGAYRTNPADAVAGGHFIDALILSDKIVEAHDLIARFEKAGGNRYGANARARIMRREGDFESARNLYLDTAARFSDDEEVHRSKAGAAECLRDMHRYEEALAEYEQLVAQRPTDEVLQSGLASVLMDLGRFDEAQIKFGALTNQRGNIVALNGEATALRHAGRLSEALAKYDAILADYPTNSATQCGRAEVLREMDDLHGALAAYETAIATSGTAFAYAGKIELLRELGRFGEAEATASEASRLFPHDERIALSVAHTLRRRGEYVDALRSYDGVISQKPYSQWARWGRADTLKRLGRFQAAHEEFDRVLRQWPTFESAITAKAALLIGEGRLHEAEALLPAGPLVSARDYGRLVLRALLVREREGIAPAIDLLRPHVRHVPFAKQNRYLISAVAAMELERGRAREAKGVAIFRPGEISNVIYLHGLAAADTDKVAAKRAYEAITASEVGLIYYDLATEIAKRYGVIDGPPDHPLNWISLQERRGLLAEAV